MHSESRPTSSRRFHYLWALPAFLLGVVALHDADVGTARIAFHAALFAAGGIACFIATGRRVCSPQLVVTSILIALLAATLIAPGLDGVHRWLGAGPLRVNVSLLIAPWLLIAANTFVERRRAWLAVGTVLLVQLIHLAQPDAAQATAFAAGSAVVLLSAIRQSRLAAIIGSVGSVLLAACSLVRSDPLDPVREVEGIVGQVGRALPGGEIIAVLALALLLAPIALDYARSRDQDGTSTRTGRAALLAYLLIVLVTPVVLHVPVIVMGLGASTVLAYASILIASSAAGNGKRVKV